MELQAWSCCLLSLLFLPLVRERGARSRAVSTAATQKVLVLACQPGVGRHWQGGLRPHRQPWHKATWPLRKSRQGQSLWYLVLAPAQLKSSGSFCR